MGLFDNAISGARALVSRSTVQKSFSPATQPLTRPSLGPVAEAAQSEAVPAAERSIWAGKGGQRGFAISTPTTNWVEKMMTDYAALNSVLVDRIGAAVTPFDPYLLMTFLDSSGYLSGGCYWKGSITTGQGYTGDPELLAHLVMANERDTFQDVLDQWTADVDTFGNAYIEVARMANTCNFYNMAALRTRVKPNKGTNFLSFVHYEYGLGMLVYRMFDEFAASSQAGVRQFKLISRRGHRYYGDPEYISAKRPLVLNYDILSLAEKFFENSFMGDTAITFKGADYTDEDIERFRQYLTSTVKGLDNAHKIVVFQVAPTEDVKIEKLNLDIKDAAFAGLRSDNKEEIVIANRVPPAILGIASPGKLSNTNEIREALRVFQLGFGNARQRKFEMFWQHLFRDAGLPKWETFRLNKMSIIDEDASIEGPPGPPADALATMPNKENAATGTVTKASGGRIDMREFIQEALALREELMKADAQTDTNNETHNG